MLLSLLNCKAACYVKCDHSECFESLVSGALSHLIHQSASSRRRREAVHPQVRPALAAEKRFEQSEHAFFLRKQQNAVAVRAPGLQHLHQHFKLAAQRGVAEHWSRSSGAGVANDKFVAAAVGKTCSAVPLMVELGVEMRVVAYRRKAGHDAEAR